MKTYEVKIGRGSQSWQSPYDYLIPQPKAREHFGESASIEEALDHPIGSPSMESMMKGAKSLLIAVPDITRGWYKIPPMAEAVRRRVAAACPDARITWIVATGQHRAVTEQDFPMIFGGAVMPGDEVLCHDCTNSVSLNCSTPSGTPVAMDPAFAAAEHVVLIGGISFHDMAGFSGGRKMVMPGLSDRQSIIVNHNHCLTETGLNPATDSGLIDNNPMAQDQRAYTELAIRGKKVFILNTVIDGAGVPAAWVAGDIFAAWEAGCKASASMASLWIPEKASRTVVSCGGFPLDLDLYQATKAMFAPLAAMKPGAPVVLVADLEDSLGPGDYGDMLRKTLKDSQAVLEEMKRGFTVPGYIALRTVLEVTDHPAALVTNRQDVPFPGKVFRTVAEADAWLQEVSGGEGLSMLIPSGNAIHVFTEN